MDAARRVVLCFCLISYALGFLSESSTFGDNDFADSVARRSSGSFKLRTPHFSLSPRPWIDVEKAQNHWQEVNARLNVYMNSKLDLGEPHGVDYASVLRKDIALSDKLDKEVQRMNAAIQAEPAIRVSSRTEDAVDGFSLLETGDGYMQSDWNFCTCPVGPNGTLVYQGRNWPGVVLPTPPVVNLNAPSGASLQPSMLELRTTSMLRLTVKGKRVAVARSPVCNCANPWENFSDPSGSSICSLNQEVTVCIVKRNLQLSVKSKSQLQDDATALLTAIDSAFGIDHPTIVASPSTNVTLESVVTSVAAGNYTSDFQPVDANASTTTTTTTIIPSVSTSASGDLAAAAEAAATIVPYQGPAIGETTAAPPSGAGTSEPGSWEVLRNMTWEAANGEQVTDTIVTKVLNASENNTSSSFAQVWTPFQFSI
jgi:hypothetical protein